MADKLIIQDLQNIKLLELYEKHFKEVVAFSDEAKEADWFVKNVGPVILKNKKELGMYEDGLYRRYEKLLILNKWISLSIRPDDDFIDLFKNHFTYIFQLPDNIEMWKKIKAKLQAVLAFEDRDEIKAKIRKVLLANTEILTKKEIVFDNKRYSGTVGNWLQDYNRVVGTGKVDKLKKEKYLINSDNTKRLDIKDRTRVSFLINLYERLKLSSLTPEGLEDPVTAVVNGKLVSLIEGRFEPISPKVIEILKKMKKKGLVKEIPSTLTGEQIKEIGPEEENKTAQKVVDEYAEARRQWRGLTEPVRVSSPAESLKEDSAAQSEISHQSPLTGDSDGERIPISAQSSTQILQEKYRGFLVGDLMKNVWAKEEQLKLETGKDLKALRNNFYHAVNNGQKEQALGALLALAENGQIRAAFGDDERFVKFWGGYLEKNTPLSRRSRDTSPKLGEEDIVATFRNDPAGAKFLAMFFKYILEQRLKLPAEQAVMIGMAVSNLARKAGKLEYQTMVYGDMESQKFQWNF